MKGISAMIATVLLIAFTIAIGGIVSVWLTGLTTTQTQQVSNQSSAQAKCTPSLSIDLVKVPSGVLPLAANVTFSNPSQQTITSITVLLPNNGSAIIYSPLSQTLGPGLIGTAYANVTALPTFVKVSGLCSGLPVSTTCDNTMACWQTG
jgi:flagellin-like protein